MKQTTLRTDFIKWNNNISFPIGTILTVQKYSNYLDFHEIFGKHKRRGRDITRLVEALVSYKLTENLSVSCASYWINRKEVLQQFKLPPFNERTLFRVLETIGSNYEEIIIDIQDTLFRNYNFEHTDINLDWSSLILYGDKSVLGKCGYSRDHRPDKKQLTFGIAELSSPINVPIGLTVEKGNMNDMKHFKKTYRQVRRCLRPGSLVTIDRGAPSKDNLDLIVKDKMKYLTAKKLNKSDDKRIKTFDKAETEPVDQKNGVYGEKYEKPSKYDYFFYSENLYKHQIEQKYRKAMRKFEEAKEIQTSLDKNKTLPKKYRINNELVDVTYSYQTKLKALGEKEAMRFIKKVSLNGREGFFCVTSTENLTLAEALVTYRKKDSIEKIINSLKNEIEIKPVRVWTEKSIRGALIIGFLAQLIISLIRYENKTLKHMSTKFIKMSLMNLTVTFEKLENWKKRCIFSNFDTINWLILGPNKAVT